MPNSFRNRVWTFILYPDSLVNNFEDIINGDTNPRLAIANVPLILSPIHDMDIAKEGHGWRKDKEGNEYKKPHYQAMIMFSQVKSYSQVSEMVSCLQKEKPVHVSQVHSTQSMIRYFIHADHKDKAQYRKEDIKAYNGADIDHIFEKNDQEINGILRDMINFIEDNDINEFSDFIKISCEDEYFNDWFPLASGKYQFFIVNYLKSKHFKEKAS